VTVRSISWSSEPLRPPSADSMTLRFLSVVGSMTRQSVPVRNETSRMWARSAFCVSCRYCTSAPAALTAAGCPSRP
jgi:hypothetical protein